MQPSPVPGWTMHSNLMRKTQWDIFCVTPRHFPQAAGKRLDEESEDVGLGVHCANPAQEMSHLTPLALSLLVPSSKRAEWSLSHLAHSDGWNSVKPWGYRAFRVKGYHSRWPQTCAGSTYFCRKHVCHKHFCHKQHLPAQLIGHKAISP